MFYAGVSGSTVRFTNITVTWDARTTLGALSELTDSGIPAADAG